MIPELFAHVTTVVHSDWSTNPAKRWKVVATLQPNQRWKINELAPVGPLEHFFPHLQSHLQPAGCILAGFDFPIGLPAVYAARSGIHSFIDVLPRLGREPWADFYTPAIEAAEICLGKPFYPSRPGHARRIYLEQGLGIPFQQLFRLCEMSHENRRAACPLFWTMGCQQVGKAAISGWRGLLAPGMQDPRLHLQLWPFSGTLPSLLNPGNIVVVETYPAEFYTHLGLSFSGPIRRSKRRQHDRQAFASQLIAWAEAHQVDVDLAITAAIQSGFGSGLDGEDQFDALVGAYGMINVIQGNHPYGEPNTSVLSRIEGWIFGQEGP